MPFDFRKYDAKCSTMDPHALQLEWEHYTRLISGAAASTAVSGMAIPFTLGMSSIGVGLAAPAIHNARKKREIIEKHLQRHGRTHQTRKRDVITAGAISGTVGVVTLGLAPVGADVISSSAAEHGIAFLAENELGVKIATHLALDAAAVAAEETHMHSKKEQEMWKAYAQGVQEGKNPPRPTSDMKMPAAEDHPLGNSQASYQCASFQAAPSINVVPTGEDKSFMEAPPPFFPPPPAQTGLTVESSLHRRHSMSTLSFDAHETSSEMLQPQPNGKLMYGTTTAISAPMVGGQSYYIQPPLKSTDRMSRPSSANGVDTLPVDKLNAQQYQTWNHTQRPKAYSTASFDRPSSYEMYPQQQSVYDPSGLSPQSSLSPSNVHTRPPPPPYPPVSPLHQPSLPVSSHLMHTSLQEYSIPQNWSQHSQNKSYNNQQSWSAPPYPNNYTSPPSQQQQTQTFHAPPQLVYFPQDMKCYTNDQKGPLVYQYEVPSPGSAISPQYTSVSTPTATVMHYTSPSNHPASYFPTYAGSHQIPYFPPPPTAH